MATYRNIGVEESATVTARVATVQVARGSTNEQQEIMVLGDAESSLGLARVLNSAPASTEYGLAVRLVDLPSTIVSVSTGSVRVHQSTAADLNVTVAGYSTTANVSSVAGIVTVRASDTNWASSAGFHFNSSGELQVAGTFAASTTVNVSSVAGIVTVRGSDTNWASSAGFHFNSSGELQVAGTFSASTTVNVSSVAGVVTVNPSPTSNSSIYMPVRLSDGTAFITVGMDYTDGSTYSSLTAPGVAFNNSSNNTFRTVGLTTPLPIQVTDSSNAPVKPGDSANNALRVNVVAGAAGGSTIVTVSTGSVRVHQSSAGDLNVTVAGYSTTANISSVAGIVTVRGSDTNWASSAGFHFNSSGELQVVGTFSASTTVNVSSVAGIVTVRGSDTNWASSAGFHFNSSGELQVVGTFAASTTVNVSSVAGVVTVEPRASSNSSVYMPIRLTNGTAFLTPSVDYLQGSTFTSTGVQGPAAMVRAGAAAVASTDVFVMPWASTHGAQYIIPVTDSGVSVMDSTNRAINVNVVAGAAGGSTIVSVSTGSVRVHQSTAADLNVTVAGYSTTVNVSSVAGIVTVRGSDTNWASSAGFHFNSSGELQVSGTFAASTTVNVSSVAGIVTVRGSDTNWASSAGFHFNSSGELQVAGTFAASTTVNVSSVAGVVTVEPMASSNSSVYMPIRLTNGTAFLTPSVDYLYGSTFTSTSVQGPVGLMRAGAASTASTDTWIVPWVSSAGTQRVSLVDSADVALVGSSRTPASTAHGLVVRQGLASLQSFASSQVGQSSATTIVSSNAATIARVYAYTITSTTALQIRGGFFSSNTLKWPVVLQANGAGITGVNLSVTPPAYLFEGAVSNALTFNVDSTAIIHCGVSYWTETP